MISEPRVATAVSRLRDNPVAKYLEIQEQFATADLSPSGAFTRAYCNFYRVRRSKKYWRPHYFGLMAELRTKRDQGKAPPSFVDALSQLACVLPCTKNGNQPIEASFVSKMLATIDPDQPVLDSVLLSHCGRRLPLVGSDDRLRQTVEIFADLAAHLRDELASSTWPERRAQFDDAFQELNTRDKVSDMKALDFIIWASGENYDETYDGD